MTKVNLAETKAHLSKYINMAEFAGEEIVIQKHGRPVAALINIELYEKLKRMDLPINNDKLVYKKLNYKEHIAKSSYTLGEMLSLIGDEEKEVKPFSDIDDVAAFSKELRNSAWSR
ncbi:MAG: type II toxin-antitoxin system Phd/YefM family antitoxin [Sulfurimonas sp.]|jgi:prevent-host-death family protein